MKIILIVCGIYIISMMAMYSWVRISHSEGGYLSGTPLDSKSMSMTFTPVVNTVAAVIGWTFYYPLSKESKSLNLERFFQIKRDNDDSKN